MATSSIRSMFGIRGTPLTGDPEPGYVPAGVDPQNILEEPVSRKFKTFCKQIFV